MIVFLVSLYLLPTLSSHENDNHRDSDKMSYCNIDVTAQEYSPERMNYI